MPWKVGGNFEAVWIMCETNWKECAIAVANYLWSEVVSDVVDYLMKEGTIWILVIAITFTILFRIKYRKNVRTENIIASKQILSKVGRKIQDLELKVDILTYKMQYGTWPLPHQIYSLNPKKLKKIRMTLSNPGDRKNWIKHVLLNRVESDIHASYSNVFNPSVTKLTNFFGVKQNHTPHHAHCDKLSADCSNIRTSKSTSDQSVNAHFQDPGRVYAQNLSTKGSELSKSENFTLQRQHVQLRPLDSDKINCQPSKTILIQSGEHGMFSTNERNSCQKFTDTVRKCRSFLKELERDDKDSHPLSCSSERSEASSSADPALLAMEKKVSFKSHEPVRSEEITETKRTKGLSDAETMEDADKACRRSNVNTSTDVAAVTNNDGVLFPQQLLPIIQPAHDAQSSRETLYEVRRRLQSLRNVLRTYEDAGGSLERRESTGDRGDEAFVETFVSVGSKVEATEGKIDANGNSESIRDLRRLRCSVVDSCEYFELDRSEGSSSSLAEYSSNASNKTYRCSSDVPTFVSRNVVRSKGYDQRKATRRSIWMSDLPAALTSVESNDHGQHSRFRNATLHKPQYYKNRSIEENVCERDGVDQDRSHESKPSPKVDDGAMEVEALFDLGEERPGAVSERTRRVSSPESYGDDESVKIQNEVSWTRKVATERYDDVFDGKREDAIIISQNSSRSEMSKNSDRGEKSTAWLLQEALRFKKALLTRVESGKKCLARDTNENDVTDKSSSKCRAQIRGNDNFPSMVLDIETEGPIVDARRGKVNQRYLHLEMKQRRDLLPRSSQDASTPAHYRDGRDTESKAPPLPEISSEYFSISDLAIYNSTSNVSLESPQPIYEKVISITMPVNVESQGVIDASEKSMQTVFGNIEARANSRQDLSESANVDDNERNVANRPLPPVLKLEDLILERVKNIRDYMDSFLQSQNRAIFKARKALQCRGEIGALRRSNEASHVILHNQFAASSRDRVVSLSQSSQRPDLSMNARPDYEHETSIEDDIPKCRSDLCTMRSPETFALVASAVRASSDENDAQWSELNSGLIESRETDLSPPVTPRYPRENDAKTTREMNSDAANCEEREYVASHLENDRINERGTAGVNMERRRPRQTQVDDSEIEFAATSHHPFDVSRANANVARMSCGDERAARYHCNSISRSSSYFTDEIASVVKMDGVSSKSTSDTVSTCTKLDARKGAEQSAIEGQMDDKRSDADTSVKSSELRSSAKYSSSTLIGLNSTPDKSKHDHSTGAETTLKGSNVTRDSGSSPLSPSSSLEEKPPSTDDNLSNDGIKQSERDEAPSDVARLSSQIERRPAEQLDRAHSRIKAKSDISLINTVDSSVNLSPKRSHSFIMRRDALENICTMLGQSNVKPQDNEDKYIENELRPVTQSKSTILSQRVSTRSCIPILKNLETARRMKHQTHARSPTRSPLTMLWRGKNSHTAEDEDAREGGTPMNKHPFVEETALNLTKVNTGKSILAEESEKTSTTRRDSNAASKDRSEIPSSDQAVKSLAIGKERSDKRFICGSRSDTKIVERIENTDPKVVTIISIAPNDSSQNYPVNSFILKTGNIYSTADQLRQKKEELWTIEKREKEVTAKPSITDMCTSMSELH